MSKNKMSKKGYIGFGFMVFIFGALASIVFGMIFVLPIMFSTLLTLGYPVVGALVLGALIIIGIPIFFMILGWAFYNVGRFRRRK